MTPIATQNVTAVDLQEGRIRCGVKIKPYLPTSKTTLTVSLKGTELDATYDPRNGPDRSRSGVLKIDKSDLHALVDGPCELSFHIAANLPSFT